MRLLASCLLSLLIVTPQVNDSPSAVVTPKEATFSIPVKARDRWTWRRVETPDNRMEYRMDVTVKNEGNEYTFGFYLWKYHDASQASGSLSDLIAVGQKDLFVRRESNLMKRERDAEVKVKAKGDVVVISLSRRETLKQLFSSKPSEVVFKIKVPGEDEVRQTVNVIYQ